MNRLLVSGMMCALALGVEAMGSDGWPNKTPQDCAQMRKFQWEKARPRVLDWFRRNWYGYAPVGRPDDEVFGENFISCAGGRIRIELEVFVPKGASRENPAPVFVLGDHRMRPQVYPNVPVEEIVRRGYAFVRYNFNDVAPDRYMDDIRRIAGVFAVYGGWDRPDGAGWGKVAAWAWGFSRVMDWIETRPELDARRVAVVGHSRGGKTALWAAAQDERITMAVSNNSGTGGAHLNEMITPGSEQVYAFLDYRSWNFFCPNFLKFDGCETTMEHDADDLIRLIAPRLVYVASASQDPGAGPEGEFEATRRASELWVAYGRKGISLTAYPAAGKTDNAGHVAYHLRPGEHELAPYDWTRYLDFADRRLKRK